MVRAVSLEYGHLKNSNLEVILTSKIWAMEISRNNLEFNLENGNIEESDRRKTGTCCWEPNLVGNLSCAEQFDDPQKYVLNIFKVSFFDLNSSLLLKNLWNALTMKDSWICLGTSGVA